MVLEGLPVLGALVIAALLIFLAVRVIKETLWIGAVILVILMVLFFGFGITPISVYREILRFPAKIQEVWPFR